jgi:hypothetical protein
MSEVQKPEEEIDWEYVKLCEILLSSFLPQRKLSKWGIKKRVNLILNRRASGSSFLEENKAKPVSYKFKPAFVALIAAVVLMLSCVTVCATTTFDENILKALNLGLNQSFEDEGITYIYGGKSVNYKTIDEFLDSENISICYPEKIAYNAKLLKIHRDETISYTIFVFDDPRISFEIHHETQPDPAQFDDAEIVNFKNYSFYILGETQDVACAIINNDYYILQCEDKNQLLEMIYSFNFERIE